MDGACVSCLNYTLLTSRSRAVSHVQARLARIRANVQAIYEGTQCSMSSELKKMSHVSCRLEPCSPLRTRVLGLG